MSDKTAKWYVLRAVSGKENKVKEHIDAETRNTDLSLYVKQVLIPTEKVFSVTKNGKQVAKERSCLPGYVLVEAILNGEVTSRLSNMPNVIGFLGAAVGKQPEPVRQSDMNRILGYFDNAKESADEVEIPYFVGESVKVNFGPFSGFTGIIEEVSNEKKKLTVMVKIFGRKTPLELGFTQVVKE